MVERRGFGRRTTGSERQFLAQHEIIDFFGSQAARGVPDGVKNAVQPGKRDRAHPVRTRWPALDVRHVRLPHDLVTLVRPARKYPTSCHGIEARQCARRPSIRYRPSLHASVTPHVQSANTVSSGARWNVILSGYSGCGWLAAEYGTTVARLPSIGAASVRWSACTSGRLGPRVSGGRGENGSGVRRVAGRLGLYQEREECTPRHGCSAVLAAMFTVRARRVSDWCPRFQESTANRGISRSGVDAAEGPTGVGRSAGIRSPGGHKFGLGEYFVGQSTTSGWWSVSGRACPGRHWATWA